MAEDPKAIAVGEKCIFKDNGISEALKLDRDFEIGLGMMLDLET